MKELKNLQKPRLVYSSASQDQEEAKETDIPSRLLGQSASEISLLSPFFGKKASEIKEDLENKNIAPAGFPVGGSVILGKAVFPSASFHAVEMTPISSLPTESENFSETSSPAPQPIFIAGRKVFPSVNSVSFNIPLPKIDPKR